MKIRRLRDVQRNASVAIKVVLIISALLLLSRVGVAQEQTPSPRDVVSPFQVAVVFKIRPGFHVNAREKSADYLIATDLRAEVPTGFKAGEVAYPKGQLHTFTFSKNPLNVYEGTVTLRMPVTATRLFACHAHVPVASSII